MKSMVFKVILEAEEDGGYSVHCPELPGCHSQGETIEEALNNVREAIECYLESLKKDNLTLHKKQVVVEEIEVAV